MTEELNNTPENNDTPPAGDTSKGGNEELNLEEVVSIAPDDLSDEQKTFLEENKADLTPEQAEQFGIEKELENVDPKKVKVETRTKVPKGKPDDPKPPEDNGDDEVSSEDKKVIEQVVDDKLTDFRGKVAEVDQIKDQMEIDTYIKDNPDFNVYREVALKYLAHPAYKNIPVKNIMAIVAADNQQKIGARKEREAAKKVKETQGGGSTIRKPGAGKKNWLTVSKEDFQAKKNEVMGIKV